MSSIPHTHMASVSPWSNTSPSFSLTMRSAGIVLGISIPVVFLLIGAGVSIYLRRDAARERRANQPLPRTFIPIDKHDELESSIQTITRPRYTESYVKLMMKPFSSSFWRKSSYNEEITKNDCHSSSPSRCPDIWSPNAFFGRNIRLSRRSSEIDPERASITDKGVPMPFMPTNPHASPSTNPVPTSSRSCNLSCESRLSLPLPTVARTRSRSISLL